MARNTIQVHGARKLQRKIDRLKKSGASRALRSATHVGTRILVKEVKQEVPVDKGLTKKTVGSKVQTKKYLSYGIVGSDVAKLQALFGNSDPEMKRPTNIDHLIEFGHVAFGSIFIPPNGYMRRAAMQAKVRAEKAFANKLASNVEQELMR